MRSADTRIFVEQGAVVANNQPGRRPILPLTFIGNHDVSRIASVVGDNGAVLAAVAQLTLPVCRAFIMAMSRGFGVKSRMACMPTPTFDRHCRIPQQIYYRLGNGCMRFING